jgi:hypothetical protein
MKRNINYFFIFLVGCFCFVMSGCIPLVLGSAVGLSVEKSDNNYMPGEFVNGILVKELKASPIQVYQSVKSAFNKLGIAVLREQYDLHYAAVLGSFSDGKEVVVNIEEIKPFVSKLKIKVGDIGDLRQSDNILKIIMKEL